MNLSDQKVCIVGLGRSGVAAARLVHHLGGIPFITDQASRETAAEFADICDAEDLPYENGGYSSQAFADMCMLVLSPGVPADIPPAVNARRKGIPVLGELELASRFCTARMLAVTGTNGKTTTTELLYALIEGCGRSVALAGNNATPLSELVLRRQQPEWVVLEVSSYQLETCSTFHPWIACVLNLTPDHLGRHRTMEAYAAVKESVFSRQEQGDIAIVNADDPIVAAMPTPEGVSRLSFSLRTPVANGLWCDGESIYDADKVVAQRADVPLPGRHNLENALAALTVAHAAGLPWPQVLDALRAFHGVEHRLEYVRCIDGVEYYNDSKSTNIDSLRVALEAFDKPIILIAGGRGKGAAYEPLRQIVAARLRHLIVVGEEAPALEAAFSSLVPTESAQSMDAAVRLAAAQATAGDVVLLSPACASFDMYRNYEDRGTHFKNRVHALAAVDESFKEDMLCAKK